MPAPRITIATRVTRLEVSSHDGRGEEVGWSLLAFHAAKIDPGMIIMVGHLTVSHGGSWGQALVQASARRPKVLDGPANVRRFIGEYASGLAEQTYDEARRALTSSGALMDIDLHLPTKAPDAPIQIVAEPELDEGAEDENGA